MMNLSELTPENLMEELSESYYEYFHTTDERKIGEVKSRLHQIRREVFSRLNEQYKVKSAAKKYAKHLAGSMSSTKEVQKIPKK